jgi:hypothetical protein
MTERDVSTILIRLPSKYESSNPINLFRVLKGMKITQVTKLRETME